MGWPKKNEVCRLYLERAPKTYLLVRPESMRGKTEYTGELMSDPDPEHSVLTHGYANLQEHLLRHCRRVQWDEMPGVWRQKMLLKQFMGPWVMPHLYENPYSIRGLWRVENFQSVRDKADAFEDMRTKIQEWLALLRYRDAREFHALLRHWVDVLEPETKGDEQ